MWLKRLWEIYHELNWSLRQIPALSFVPDEVVTLSFHMVHDGITKDLDAVESNFQCTCIKSETIETTSCDPFLQQKLELLWRSSCSGQKKQLIRTTNVVEGWHFGVATLFEGNHSHCSLRPYTFFEANQIGCWNSNTKYWKQWGVAATPGARIAGNWMRNWRKFATTFTKNLFEISCILSRN